METTLHQSDTLQPERRGSPRHKVFKGGTIIFNNGYGVADCVVRNQSDSGVLISMGETTGVPQRFTLRIGDGTPRSAEIRWRREKSLGVSLA
jgi:hypothetical protein